MIVSEAAGEDGLTSTAVVISVFGVIATCVAPVIALQMQQRLQEHKERLGRKLWIFKTLMSYRATRLNANFVQALNMIDIEFTDNSERDLRDSWRELHDHYQTWGGKPEARRKLDDKADLERAEELLAVMLAKMGSLLGYSFDKVYIRKGFYYPEGLGNIEAEQHMLRRSVLALLSGRGMKLPVAVFSQDFQPLAGVAAAKVGKPPEGLDPPPIELRPAVTQGNGAQVEETS